VIKNMARGLAALTLALTPLAVPASAHAAPEAPGTSYTLPLTYAIDQTSVTDESRAG
jgi:hypothetical protein